MTTTSRVKRHPLFEIAGYLLENMNQVISCFSALGLCLPVRMIITKVWRKSTSPTKIKISVDEAVACFQSNPSRFHELNEIFRGLLQFTSHNCGQSVNVKLLVSEKSGFLPNFIKRAVESSEKVLSDLENEEIRLKNHVEEVFPEPEEFQERQAMILNRRAVRVAKKPELAEPNWAEVAARFQENEPIRREQRFVGPKPRAEPQIIDELLRAQQNAKKPRAGSESSGFGSASSCPPTPLPRTKKPSERTEAYLKNVREELAIDDTTWTEAMADIDIASLTLKDSDSEKGAESSSFRMPEELAEPLTRPLHSPKRSRQLREERDAIHTKNIGDFCRKYKLFELARGECQICARQWYASQQMMACRYCRTPFHLKCQSFLNEKGVGRCVVCRYESPEARDALAALLHKKTRRNRFYAKF